MKLCSKLVLLAACVALAPGPSTASQQAHLHVRVHHQHDERLTLDGSGSRGNDITIGTVSSVRPVPRSEIELGNQTAPSSLTNSTAHPSDSEDIVVPEDDEKEDESSDDEEEEDERLSANSGTSDDEEEENERLSADSGSDDDEEEEEEEEETYTSDRSGESTAATDECTGKDESPVSVEGIERIFCVTGQACVDDIADGACPGKQEGLPHGASCGLVKTGVYGCKSNSSRG